MLHAIQSSRTGMQESQSIELAARRIAFDISVFVGPTLEHWPEGLRFHWNQSPPSLLDWEGELASGFTSTSSSVDLVDASDLPDSGMVWVNGHPVAYEDKSGNSLTSLHVLDTESWSADSGDPVRVFWPLSEYHHSDVSLSANLRGRVFRWDGQLSFFELPKRFFSSDFSIAVIRRKWIDGSWTPRHLWFMGWISEVSIQKDYLDVADVKIKVEGLSYKLANSAAPELSRGSVPGGGGGSPGGHQPTSVAGVSTRASSVLVDKYLEADSDDWELGEPASVDSDNVVDGNLDTVWISNGEPNNISWEDPNPLKTGFIDEVFMRPWPGFGPEYQWFRIWIIGPTLISQLRIYNDQTQYSGGDPSGFYLDLADSAMADQVVKQKPIILCKNITAFRSAFDPQDVPVIEWSSLRGASRNARSFTLSQGDGFLYIRTKYAGFNDGVAWGGGSGNPPDFHLGFWSGPWVPLPARGHAIRRFPAGQDTDTSADWREEPSPAPGEYRGKPRENSEDAEWIAADLGEMEWELGQDLAADPNDPADGEIQINLEGKADTSGLDNSGIIRVGTELIQYSGRTNQTITGVKRGVHGTQPSVHHEGESVYLLENGVATRARKISSIRFIRKEGLWPVPYMARMFVSKFPSPRFPPTENWQLDWGNQVRAWTRTLQHIKTADFPDGKRIRWVMFIIDQMGAIVGRTIRSYTSTDVIEVVPNRWYSKMPNIGQISVGEFRVEYTKNGNFLELSETIGPIEMHEKVVYLGGRARLNEIEFTQSNIWSER